MQRLLWLQLVATLIPYVATNSTFGYAEMGSETPWDHFLTALAVIFLIAFIYHLRRTIKETWLRLAAVTPTKFFWQALSITVWIWLCLLEIGILLTIGLFAASADVYYGFIAVFLGNGAAVLSVMSYWIWRKILKKLTN